MQYYPKNKRTAFFNGSSRMVNIYCPANGWDPGAGSKVTKGITRTFVRGAVPYQVVLTEIALPYYVLVSVYEGQSKPSYERTCAFLTTRSDLQEEMETILRSIH